VRVRVPVCVCLLTPVLCECGCKREARGVIVCGRVRGCSCMCFVCERACEYACSCMCACVRVRVHVDLRMRVRASYICSGGLPAICTGEEAYARRAARLDEGGAARD
jgi:hypothetical protein